MTPHAGGGLAGLALTVPDDPCAKALFTGRHPGLPGDGNVSLVVGDGRPQAARASLLGALGLGPGDAVFMEQVHGAGVAHVGRADRGRGAARHEDAIAGVDALVTDEPDVALVVMVADCVPVLLVDPGRAVAAVHAGRRGVEHDVVGAAVAALGPQDPAAVQALVGPAIGACCYEVPESLAADVVARVPEAEGQTTWGSASLDLPAAVDAQLRRRGVQAVAHARRCTRCESDEWFSHRADPGLGRQAGAVCRLSEPLPAATGAAADSRPASLDWWA